MKRECTSQLTFRNPRVSIGFALYAAGLVLAMAFIGSVVAGDNDTAELSQSVPPHAPGKWKATGDLGTARFSHTATLLLNGQVLVTGGIGSDGLTVLASAELYDPATGVWTTTGSMTAARINHTATLLLNGQVLVTGGNEDPGSAEVYDPASGSWTRTNNLSPSRARHTATLLPNEQVLVAGGQALFRYGILSRAQLYKSAPEMLDLE